MYYLKMLGLLHKQSQLTPMSMNIHIFPLLQVKSFPWCIETWMSSGWKSKAAVGTEEGKYWRKWEEWTDEVNWNGEWKKQLAEYARAAKKNE